MAILNSGDKGLSAYVTEVYKTIINDFVDIVDGSVRADKFRDGAAADAALTFALTGDIDQAEKFSANILDPKVRIDVSEKILKVSQSKVPLIFKDPLVAAQIQEFNSTKRIGVVPGVRPLNQPIPRRTIANNAVNAETEYSWNEDKQALMATAIEIASNPDIPASERKSQISKAITEMTAARRARQEIFNVEFGKLENIIAENEKTFQDSTGVILNAFGAGIIDANSRDALLAAEKVFKSNVQPDEQTVEKNVRFVFSETAKPFFKEEQVNDPYFNKKFVRSVKPVIGPPSATFEISSEGQNEVIAISNLVREELIKAYAENKTAEFSQKYGFNLPTDPTVLRSSTADLAIRAAISAATKKLIEKRRTEFKP